MMFTGLVDHCGQIEEVMHLPIGLRLGIRSQFENLALGESISVEGICLTVTEMTENKFYCELSPETLNLTTAKNFESGQAVNLERALTLNTPLGGHFVTGHVDASIRVKAILIQDEEGFVDANKAEQAGSLRAIAGTNPSHSARDNFWHLAFEGLTDDMLKYIVKKGSVTINGVSLTVNEVSNDGFSVMLIPHTLERTSLKTLKVHDAVNIEWDYFGRIIVNYLDKFKENEHERNIA